MTRHQSRCFFREMNFKMNCPGFLEKGVLRLEEILNIRWNVCVHSGGDDAQESTSARPEKRAVKLIAREGRWGRSPAGWRRRIFQHLLASRKKNFWMYELPSLLTGCVKNLICLIIWLLSSFFHLISLGTGKPVPSCYFLFSLYFSCY